jgi:voltage-gated potassium channel Kch
MTGHRNAMSARRAASAVWVGVVLLAAVAFAVLLPVELVLGAGAPATLAAVRRGLLLLFALDVPVSLARARKAGDPAWRDYVRKLLVIDVAAALPLAFASGPGGWAWVGLIKLVRVASAMLDAKRRLPRYAGLVGFAFTGFWLLLVVHWVCAGWLLLRGVDPGTDLLANYVEALYWAVATLTTVGYGDITPQNTVQRVYAIGTMVVGLSFIGYLIGLMASFLAQRDPARAIYRENMERLSVAARHRRIPGELEQKIVDYYAYAWRQRLAYDETEFLASLPSALREEVALHMKSDVLEQVELFQGADPEFVRYVALRLRPEVLTPGDWVFREGDEGTCMYFITRGELDVLRSGRDDPVTRLETGDFFGEIALFDDLPRTASVRSVGYCDLYSLSKSDFREVVQRFPESVWEIEAKARSRRERDTTVDRGGAPG